MPPPRQAKKHASNLEGTETARWRIGEWIDDGEFGAVFEAFDKRETGEKTPYAMKFARLPASKSHMERKAVTALECERNVYMTVLKNQQPATPKLPYDKNGITYNDAYGTHEGHQYLVMEKVGPSITSIAEKHEGKLPFDAVSHIAYEVFFHSQGWVYVDIKPQNFTTGVPGTKDENTIKIIDFGMAWKYTHGGHQLGGQGAGTPNYISLFSDNQEDTLPRNDLQALAFVLLDLTKGGLPWQNELSQEALIEKKRNSPTSSLLKGVPSELATYIKYVNSLKADDKIDYDKILALFRWDPSTLHGFRRQTKEHPDRDVVDLTGDEEIESADTSNLGKRSRRKSTNSENRKRPRTRQSAQEESDGSIGNPLSRWVYRVVSSASRGIGL